MLDKIFKHFKNSSFKLIPTITILFYKLAYKNVQKEHFFWMLEIFVVTLKVMENILDYTNLMFLKNDTQK